MKCASTLALVALAACSSEQSSSSTSLTREPGECADVEVHVIGVSDGGGESTVILSRPGRHVLVVSGFAATRWNIDVRPGATLERVYAVGHYPQSVVTNVKTQVTTESAVEGGADANGYMYPNPDAVALMRLAAIRVERHPTSFHGCFSAKRWEIGEDMSVTSDCAAGTYTQYDAVIDCDGDNLCGDGDDGTGSGGGGGGGGGDGSLY